MALVREHGLENRVLLSSFNPLALRKAKRLVPDLPVALLVAPKEPVLVRLLKDWMADFDFLHPHKDLVRGSLIQKQHDLGCRVNVWTVNEPALILWLFKQGVDGIITDEPGLVVGLAENFVYGRSAEMHKSDIVE